jgi:hypothetical protein
MDGIRLHEALKYEDTSGFEISVNGTGSRYIGATNNVGHDGDSTGVLIRSEEFQNTQGLSWNQLISQDNVIMQNLTDVPLTIRLVGRSEIKCTGMTSAPPYSWRSRFITSQMAIGDQDDFQIHSALAMNPGTTYGADFDITITLQKGEALLRESFFYIGVGLDAKIEYTENSKFDIEFITRRVQTYVLHLPPQYLFNELIKKVTDGLYTAAPSDLLSQYSNIVFTR